MDDVVVVERPHHLADGVAFADGGEELVAQALTFRRAADDAGDVHEGDGRRHHRRSVVHGREHLETGVGDGDHTDVRLNCGEGVVGREDAVVGQRVEERGLADVRQPDDPD